MLTNQQRKELSFSLSEAIELWLDNQRITIPFTMGENTTSIMADSALAVLYGIEDAHQYMLDEGMIKED